MNKKELIAGAVIAVSGIGLGYVSGYLITKKRLVKHYDEVLEAEIESVKKAYDPSRKEGIFATPEGAVKVLITDRDGDLNAEGRRRVEELIRDNSYAVDPEQENEWKRQAAALDAEERVEDQLPDGDTIMQSIWNNSANRPNPEAIDPSEEMPAPSEDRPYIITIAQFMTDGVHEDNKVSLLYFEEDGQLVDEREALVSEIERTVGENNLQNFGLGSKDRNALYVRNERLDCDFEIIRDSRSFSEVILGVKPERNNLAPRKMRNNDE